MKPPGNKTWGRKPIPGSSIPVLPTQFELLAAKLECYTLDAQIRSRELRDWVKIHCHSRYVPENLLKALGYDLDSDLDRSSMSLGLRGR